MAYGTLDSYELARTMIRLRPLGLYGPPSALVARWLEEHTKEQRTTPEPFMFVPALSDDGNMEGCS